MSLSKVTSTLSKVTSTLSILLLTAVTTYSLAEGKASKKEDLQPPEDFSKDEVMHIHNLTEPTAAGMPEGESYVIHEDAMEEHPHGHKVHPHTIKGAERHGMRASDYKREMFGSD